MIYINGYACMDPVLKLNLLNIHTSRMLKQVEAVPLEHSCFGALFLCCMQNLMSAADGDF